MFPFDVFAGVMPALTLYTNGLRPDRQRQGRTLHLILYYWVPAAATPSGSGVPPELRANIIALRALDRDSLVLRT